MIRNSETKNSCSVSVVYKWHEIFINGKKSTEDDLRDGRHCVLKMTIKDKVNDILFTPISKTLTILDVLKQQLKFYRNDIGALYQHIEFSRRFYSVANNADKVDHNCEL